MPWAVLSRLNDYTELLAHSSHSKPFLKSNFSKLLKLSIFFNYPASFFSDYRKSFNGNFYKGKIELLGS